MQRLIGKEPIHTPIPGATMGRYYWAMLGRSWAASSHFGTILGDREVKIISSVFRHYLHIISTLSMHYLQLSCNSLAIILQLCRNYVAIILQLSRIAPY